MFDVLEFLIRNRDHVVTKQDLMQNVWRGRIVSESALSTRLNAARAAIHDDGKSQHLIKTLPRKGIRFVGTVTEREESRSGSKTGSLAPFTEPLELDAGDHPRPIVAPLDLPSIAVLPFRCLDPDRLCNYFGDGMVEDITTSLANLQELFVISRGSTLTFRENEFDLGAVGRALGVRYVVTGCVRRSGKKLRISTELSDSTNGQTIWSERTDGVLGDLFDVQDRIVEHAVACIAPNIRQAELKRALRKAPQSLSAYDYTLRALDCIYKVEKDCLDEASKLLTKARELDPAFALPYAWAAWTHMYRVALGWSPEPAVDIKKATHLAEAALQLPGQNARALATYGHLKSFIYHDYSAGFHYHDRALKSCPNDPLCWALSSASLSYVGQTRDAVSRAEQALRLSPFDKYRFYYLAVLSLAHYVAGEYEEAVKWGRIAHRENSAFTPNVRYLAAGLAAANRIPEAREVAASLIRRQPSFGLGNYEKMMPLADSDLAKLHLAHLRLAGLPK